LICDRFADVFGFKQVSYFGILFAQYRNRRNSVLETRFFHGSGLESEMEPEVENRRMIRTDFVWISGAVAVLLVFFCTLAMIAGSWTLQVEYNQVTISMEINAFDDSFLELRIKNGSHHTKEEMDAQEDRLDIRYDGLRPSIGLWALDGRRQLQSQD
jgi:hypothetical protein